MKLNSTKKHVGVLKIIYGFEMKKMRNEDYFIYSYQCKFQEDGDILSSTFEYYPDEHLLYFFCGYLHIKKQSDYVFSENKLKEVVETVISLPEFRLKNVVNQFKIQSLLYSF